MVSLRRIMLLSIAVSLSGIAQDKHVVIKFAELETFLKENSPKAQLLQQDLQLYEQDQKIDLQWSNPEVSLEVENVSDGIDRQTEKTLTLQKRFELPWVYAKRKQIWQAKAASAASIYQERWNTFIAEMRSGYVELKILDKQNHLLVSIKEILENTSHTVNTRFQEGALSGLDHNLLQMSLFIIESAITQLMKHRSDLENQWMVGAGLGNGYVVNRETDIWYVPVLQKADQDIPVDMNRIAGMKTRYARQAALKADLSMEKMRLMPEISLAGGYKEISPGFAGYHIGFSMPLPLLNQNRPQIEKKRFEIAALETDFLQYRQQVTGQINVQQRHIYKYQTILEKMAPRVAAHDESLQQITVAYQEGWISLNEMLNAINIYHDFVTCYNQQLVQYFQTVFQLEAITGRKMVAFN
jgi:outer membrane protein TolC